MSIGYEGRGEDEGIKVRISGREWGMKVRDKGRGLG
jgi:hypothetical protein